MVLLLYVMLPRVHLGHSAREGLVWWVPDRVTHAWHCDRDGWTAGLSWDCPLGFPPVASPEELDFTCDSPGPPEPVSWRQ